MPTLRNGFECGTGDRILISRKPRLGDDRTEHSPVVQQRLSEGQAEL